VAGRAAKAVASTIRFLSSVLWRFVSASRVRLAYPVADAKTGHFALRYVRRSEFRWDDVENFKYLWLGFCDRARNWLRHGEQPAGRFGRPCRSRRQLPAALRAGAWQAQKQARLGEHVAHAIEPPVHGDEIEQVAVFARGGVSPLAGGALAAVRPLEPDEQAAPRRVRNITDQPVSPLAAAVGEIVAAHRLGIARETVSEIGGFG
jgi:hypothetical protein